MTELPLLTFAEAHAGWTIQLLDYEGGWQSTATLLADPGPCKCLCGGLSAPSKLASGTELPQHASGDHPMQVLSRDDEDIDKARRELAERVEPERQRQEYEREKADDVNENQGDDEQ